MTSGMNSMAMSMGANTSAQMVAFVGKRVEVASDAIRVGPGAPPTSLSAEIGAPADAVTITIKDENDKVVRTLELGGQDAGEFAIAWDGLSDDGGPLPPGEYTASVDARDEEGTRVAASTWAGRRVTGVRFEGGLPRLELEGGAESSLGDVRHVGDDAKAALAPTVSNSNTESADESAGESL